MCKVAPSMARKTAEPGSPIAISSKAESLSWTWAPRRKSARLPTRISFPPRRPDATYGRPSPVAVSSFLYSCLSWSVLVVAIIFAHECGHYWTARWCGITKANVRIRMLFVPQHVALRDTGGIWVSPWQQPVYSQLCWHHFGGQRKQVTLYVAAGLIAQSIFACLGTWALFAAGYRVWSFNLFFLSVQITAVYFVLEAVLFGLRRKPFGDFSGLWLLSKGAFCLTSLAVGVLHLAAFSVFYFQR